MNYGRLAARWVRIIAAERLAVRASLRVRGVLLDASRGKDEFDGDHIEIVMIKLHSAIIAG